MKTIEEKAKAYDEALEKARQLCAYPTSKPFISDLQDLFPELKESEGRIRANIIATIHLYYGEPLEDEAKEMIAWLEKQGEQKSAEKYNITGIGSKHAQGKLGEMIKNLNSAWSEEDEKCIDELIKFFDSMKDCLAVEKRHQENRRWLKFLKSLKGTNIMQLPQEWSIEDNIRLQEAIRIVQNYHNNIKDEHLFATSGWCLGWLKSLRPQNTGSRVMSR